MSLWKQECYERTQGITVIYIIIFISGTSRCQNSALWFYRLNKLWLTSFDEKNHRLQRFETNELPSITSYADDCTIMTSGVNFTTISVNCELNAFGACLFIKWQNIAIFIDEATTNAHESRLFVHEIPPILP